MGKFYFSVLGLIACLFFSCGKNEDGGKIDPPPVKSGRTILVYMAADNNLVNSAWQNVDQMLVGMESIDGNLIVYIDPQGGTPQLLKIESGGKKTVVEEYAKENSASTSVLSRVIARTKALYPAESYGLVLWSHGLGWAPAGVIPKSYSADDLWRKDPNAPLTKWFAQDGANYIDISDLAGALPRDREFDFLLFDACFMGSVEALYELRNAAKYIIASPTEILSSGFSYDAILPELFADTPRFEEVCRLFVDYYRQSSSTWPYASVGLIKSDELDALAAAAKAFYASASPASADVSQVQYLERMQTHVFHDLLDYYSKIGGDAALYAAFAGQLRKTVVYEDHTEYVFSAYSGPGVGPFNMCVKLNTFCGLSTYVPRDLSALQLLQESYKETPWAKAVGIAY